MARSRTIASLAVSVVARVSKFIKGMKRARKALKRFAVGAAKFGAVFAGVAAGAFVVFTKRAFTALDAMAKFSSRMGIAVDTLVGFERAATLTGSSVTVLRKALTMMSKNIGEAATGTGEALEAFKALRLDAKKLQAQGVEKSFLKIGEAIGKIAGPIQQIALMSDILGTRNVELLNLFNQGPEAIRAMANEATRLFGAFTNIELKGLQDANDAISDMQLALRGLFSRVAVTIAPLVNRIVTVVTNGIVAMRDAASLSAKGLLQDFVSAAGFLLDLGPRFRLEILKTKSGLLGALNFVTRRFAQLSGVKLFAQASEEAFKAVLDQAARPLPSVRLQRLLDSGKLFGTDRPPFAKPIPQGSTPFGSGGAGGGGSFREVNLSRFALSALSGLRGKVQKVTDPQANALLKQIRDALRQPSFTVAG